jgi:hypothetical protein
MRYRWIALVMLVGCGSEQAIPESDASTTTPPSKFDAGEPPPFQLPEVDAGADAPAESGVDACSQPPLSTDGPSSQCTTTGTCSTCVGGFGYRCQVAGGQRLQPSTRAGNPHSNCRRTAELSDATDYCCPGECARSKASDATCGNPGNAMACPTQAGADALIATGNCVKSTGSALVVCCL